MLLLGGFIERFVVKSYDEKKILRIAAFLTCKDLLRNILSSNPMIQDSGDWVCESVTSRRGQWEHGADFEL